MRAGTVTLVLGLLACWSLLPVRSTGGGTRTASPPAATSTQSAAHSSPGEQAGFGQARANGVQAEEALRRTRRVLHAWLREADPRTLLLPDYTRHFRPDAKLVYTPHNSGADNYPYLVLTAWLTDRPLYEGRMLEMLRNEVRFTSTGDGLPGERPFSDGRLGPPSLFGAAEWCKDGAIAVTELLGRTPWFERMVALTHAVMKASAVKSDFGPLPDAGAEVNGDLLQTLVRLYPMTGAPVFLEFAERIGDAYVREVLPRNHGLPGYEWDFVRHEGADRLRLRDHGNEIVVGLVLLHALEESLGRERGRSYRPAIATMLDRVLQSANPDGMLFDEIRCSDLSPLANGLVDNWGYVYGSVYTHYMVTGEPRYREAVLRVLRALPRYASYDWERGRQDGYADAVESALYLLAREPVPEAAAFVESGVVRLMAWQRPDGLVEGAYPDGNWNRTLLLYALWKSQGAFVEEWQEGVRLGAQRDGETLLLSLEAPAGWRGRLRLDGPRHRQLLNLPRNFVRLNEWPEWYVVEDAALYELSAGARVDVLLGAELRRGVPVTAGSYAVRPHRPPTPLE